MLSDRDLAAYFARIGYRGPRAPTLKSLSGIVAGHACAIPFENLDVLLDRPIRIDPASLIDKLVERRRGGYCFEHNSLFRSALESLGFTVTGHAARVMWNQPQDRLMPRTHMLLRVHLPEGDYLADVGFGGLTLTSPLSFAEGDTEQKTRHEAHRLVAVEEGLELQAWLDQDWVPLYRFSDEPQYAIDYELANWFTSTYPDSLFRHHLLMARPEPERRFGLFDGSLTVRHRDGRVERRTLRSAADLAEILTRDFRLPPPARADLDIIAERIGLASA